MIKHNHKFSFVVLAFLIGCLVLPAQAQTVAHWRFEEGPEGEYVTRDNGTADVSGNNNTLYAWDAAAWCGHVYRTDVALPTVPGFDDAANNFSIQNTGNYSGLMTRSDESFPDGIDLETWSPAAFTIEVSFKPEYHTTWRGLVGRDATEVDDDDPGHAALYFQIMYTNALRFAYADVEGHFHIAQTEPGIIEGFSGGNADESEWYHAVATTDGQTMSIYLWDMNANRGWELVAQTDITESGTVNPSLAVGETSGGDWHTGGWTVSRGMYGGGHGDRYWGFIDEVRISQGALSPSEWLFATPVTITAQPSTQIVDLGDDVVFEVQALSDNSLEYQWYQAQDWEAGDDDELMAGQTSSTLSFEDVDYDDEGLFYCMVTDPTTGYSVVTRVVGMAIGRLSSYWTLDQDDFDGVSYLDVSPEDPIANDAVVTGTAEFVEGMIGDAAVIDPNNGWAVAGTYNPSQYSNELTVSFWLNWGGTNDYYQNFVSKRSGAWNTENMLWQVSSGNNNAQLWFQSTESLISVEDGLIDDGQWQHVAVTFDGSQGSVYVDGERQARAGFSFSQGVDAPIVLGNIDGDTPMTGMLDDVKIFNYAMDDFGIAEMYYLDSGQRACVVDYRPDRDWSGDCVVGLSEYAELADQWLHDGRFVPQD